ncbi:MAG: hypothetical protein NG740_01020 [Omnitrophica bacterium]|nr:hypothetical protein [Candidatus Omnitrophota bacterium]
MRQAKEENLPTIPHNEEAERACLASLILDKNLINEAIETIAPEHFYGARNRTVYKAILTLAKEGKPADLVVLNDVLKNKDVPASFLVELTASIPTSANFRHYAEILKGHYVRRLTIEKSYRHIEEAQTTDDYSGLLALVTQEFSKLAQEQIKSDILSPKELAKIGLKDFTDRLDNKIDFTGFSSGYYQLDRLCGGFGRGDLVIVAGQTSIGKSAFLLDIAYRQSIRGGLKCAYFSLEMGVFEIVYRLLSKMTFLESTAIKAPKLLKEEQIKKVIQAANALHDSNFFLDIMPIINLEKLLAKARKINAKENIDLIFIDYIQLISTRVKNQARHEVLSDITKDLKQLARELEVPVIAGAQLNRSTLEKAEPKLSHIGESFAIVQHADSVILISRNDANATLNIAKARQAKGGKFDLRFDFKTVSFVEREVANDL